MFAHEGVNVARIKVLSLWLLVPVYRTISRAGKSARAIIVDQPPLGDYVWSLLDWTKESVVEK